ncbi:hypothetical protein BGZ97_004242 [Linnemannia gamsii]|jgi:hypothetical protein|uniref:Uncharacterized protein n=1 Tax=Linnemannia gamsii TaxID=64522 RepID=A0A9P6QS24_9FUNG|nr:hypothetical protein BGZ97_004242 [Linnemannia gamsii]
MPINDANDPASHCLGLIQPFHTSFEYGQASRAFTNSVTLPTISQTPPTETFNFEGAFEHLFKLAKFDPTAVALCKDIDLPMVPPFDAGLLSYLLRLEAIGRLNEWPCLFGQGNSFVMHLIDKMHGRVEFPEDSENEKAIWDQRRKETGAWLKAKLRQPQRG